jgi:hypothetical protein
MAGEELQESWRRTERHLRDALAVQELPDDVRRMAFDFIEHNEFGVAFQYVTDALVEVGARLTPAAHDALGAAAREMGLEDNPDWVRLSR